MEQEFKSYDIALPFSIKKPEKWGRLILPSSLTTKQWEWMLRILDAYKYGIISDKPKAVDLFTTA